MSNLLLIFGLLAIMALAYQVGLTRSRSIARESGRRLHSLPRQYGMMVALWCGLPAFAVFVLWNLFEPALLRNMLSSQLLDAGVAEENMTAALRRVQALADGRYVSGEIMASERAGAEALQRMRGLANLAMLGTLAAVAIAGLTFARKRISPELRARNQVDRVIRVLLASCSAIAIMTTVGIVLSMVGEALRFFQFVHPFDFFFGTTWNPRFSTVGAEGQGSFGLLPLLWGTMMIAMIAMAVAIPIGLMTAIYLAEYAPARLRAVAKPVIEILAGIPTIVYGFFALTIVGPFLSAAGASVGIDIRATSALTAGLVMGIMIIPFVSSLSDDIITQVPRAMRDGALGLGSTRSETIKKVVLPAALPGIVGAFLLAVSRAIGETMIVVLAAGNSPVLHADPLRAVSTVTVTIVNQLTGDIDFSSPQSLVAFALGLTLFVMTLGLNVVALYIVRKYREQYE